MYIPKHNEETRVDVLHGLIHTHPFAALVVPGADELSVTHIPFILDAADGEFGMLRAHVARANPVWQQLQGKSVAIFQGPHAYISPNWYPSKQEHHKVVPTWDYAVVHVHGHVRAIEDAEWLLNFVGRLSDVHEASQPKPWSTAEAPRDYLDRLVERIVGIEMTIVRLEGKWKAHQRAPAADKLGAIAGLNAIGTDATQGVAEMIAAARPK